ncbi:MAG: hypothetical protein NC911_09560, partial [Candidatus Omnitrophica bacterium]|nr:hypothetical protein [Candidatus Omnitrophota bacterium]
KQDCGVAFVPEGNYTSHWSIQKKSRVLAVALWLLPRKPVDSKYTSHRGIFTQLNTGLAHSLTVEKNFQPGYRVLLGKPESLKIYDEQGGQVKPGERRQIVSPGMFLVAESGQFGLRFFGPGWSAPTVTLFLDKQGNTWLQVKTSRQGIKLNELEKATFCGLCLEAKPAEKPYPCFGLIPEIVRIDPGEENWQVTVRFSGKDSLALDLPVSQPVYYTVGKRKITPNLLYLKDF